MVSAHWPKAPSLETAALATALATMLVAALVPWVSLQTQPYHRNPDTPVVRLRDGRNIAYQVPCKLGGVAFFRGSLPVIGAPSRKQL